MLIPKPTDPEDQDPKVAKDKYELTLAEFPLFVLSKKGAKNVRSIEYEDTIKGKNGELVRRVWSVTPNAKYGLPGPSAMETLYDLFQIWKEEDFESALIHFGSIYRLLQRRGYSKIGNKDYKRLEKDLYQLKGIVIEAKNAFWDNEVKAYVDMAFNLFDHLWLYKEKPDGQATLPLGAIKASDVLYGSIKKNSLLLTEFDSKFFHNLSPMEQRLYLYLSKVFRSQTLHKREIMEFAKQLPIEAKERFHIREIIRKTGKGLQTKGYDRLAGVRFEQGSDSREFVVFDRTGKAPRPPKGISGANPKENYEVDLLVEDILAVCPDEKSSAFYKKVAQLMDRQTIYRALSEVKEVKYEGGIHKSPGALFTKLIKKYAKEQDIGL